MRTVLGRRSSGNVMKVLWALDELGLEYEQVDIGGKFGGNDRPDYLDKNPMGLVPTLIEDDFVMWESNSITRYLCTKHGIGTLCPHDLRTRASAETWMDWQLSAIAPMMRPVFHGLVRHKPEERDMNAIRAGIKLGIKYWSMLDKHLADRPYVAGEDFSMGDIPVGPMAHRWLEIVEDRPPMPNFEAWYKRLTERPAFRTHCMNPLE